MAGDFWSKLLQARNHFLFFDDDEQKLLMDCERRGYVFQKHPFYGVRWAIDESQDVWCKEECEAWYKEIRLQFPWHTKVFSLVESTNDEAWRAFNSEQISCGIFIAERQSQGRGRRGREWDSASNGGIYFSMCVSVEKILLPISMLTLGVGVAIFDALKPWVQEGMTLKWPNDVLINQKKVCGVLTERQFSENSQGAVVIGVGLNVHQQEEDWRDELKEIATSLRAFAIPGKTIRRAEILAHIIKECETVFRLDADEVRNRWHQRCFDLGKWIRVKQETGAVAGQLIGIDKEGALILKNEIGAIVRVYSGDCVLS